MLKKIPLYFHTVRYMKPSQVYYRLRKYLKLECTLGVLPKHSYSQVLSLTSMETLDFDPVFLDRFPVDELMSNQVTFLHETEAFSWDEPWEKNNQSPLWNFNLHYFEFLFSLAQAYKESGKIKYLEKLKYIILCWIKNNPKSNGGSGWAPYTIALRLTNWLSIYSIVQSDLSEEFASKLINSIWEQYHYLSRHLEKDLLGNHYFEDLKALILCALFFEDEQMLCASLVELKRECQEQILPDGMHFELSPMYHKIILEDMIRVCAALRGAHRQDEELEGYLQSMADVAYSLEEGLERIPLFNDGGNNVAKSLDALMKVLHDIFDITPVFKAQLPDSGYYIFKQGEWKLIVDAGQPGPDYIPGHAHCDAGSFELFKAGKPVIVNCGTYAYQCKERNFFRSTAAHNTVMVDGVEQSQCWGVFRLAKRAKVTVEDAGERMLSLSIRDMKNNVIYRTFCFGESMLIITDTCPGKRVQNHFHLGMLNITNTLQGELTYIEQPYSPEYGIQCAILAVTCTQESQITSIFKI